MGTPHPTKREREGEGADLDEGGREDGEKGIASRCVLQGVCVFAEPSTYPEHRERSLWPSP